MRLVGLEVGSNALLLKAHFLSYPKSFKIGFLKYIYYPFSQLLTFVFQKYQGFIFTLKNYILTKLFLIPKLVITIVIYCDACMNAMFEIVLGNSLDFEEQSHSIFFDYLHMK
jgi:hypothetical protein